MQILENYSLLPHNTFGMNVLAEEFVQVNSVEELSESTQNVFGKKPLLILGGGSNVLFRSNVVGRTVLNAIQGIEVVSEDHAHVIVRAGGGVIWHNLVLWAIEQGYGGIENLSLIPGSVGASPMQNIGAYGVEIKDVFHALEAVHLEEGTIKRFSLNECEFGYRSSIFKTHAKGIYAISHVEFKLSKQPTFNTSYGAINAALERKGVQKLSLKAISDAVVEIRRSKLPDPKEIGNAGSFFKNPVVSESYYNSLKSKFADIPGYPAGDGLMKIAAGWLIDQAGWKGKTVGKYGVHKKQALVLVNYGGATGDEVFELSEQIIADIHDKYGITLEREVNIL